MNEVCFKVGTVTSLNDDRVYQELICQVGRWRGMNLRATQTERRFADTRGGREGTGREDKFKTIIKLQE